MRPDTPSATDHEGLRLDGLTVDGPVSRIVEDLGLDVRAGQTLGIIGPAGSGKSTLLDVIAGQRPARSGRVLLGGQDVTEDLPGFASQQHDLLGGLTAAENVAVRIFVRRALTDSDWRAVTDQLMSLGLGDATWHNLVEQLSGGQQQRVAVARALIGDPPLLCLDDPTSELDESSAHLVVAALERAAAAGAVVVVTAQDDETAVSFDQVIRLA